MFYLKSGDSECHVMGLELDLCVRYEEYSKDSAVLTPGSAGQYPRGGASRV